MNHVNPYLCPHKLNPRACIACYHAKPAEPAAARRDPLAGVPASAKGIIGGIRAAHPLANNVAALPENGASTTITPAQAVQPAKGTPAVPQPLPYTPRAGVAMIGEAGALGPTQGGLPQRVMEPYSSVYAAESHQTDASGTWVPPERKQIIDQLPRHPSPGFQRDPG